jgi:YHS domain-containing protein
MTKTTMIMLGASVLLLGITAVVATKRISPLSWGWYGEVQKTGDLAVSGYDPVAYFAGAAAVGNADYTTQWQGATWRFASAENKAMFEATPETYAPQFGGFCSYASSKGFTATIDPMAFLVNEGKLYLFNDAKMRDNFVAEIPDGVIAKAQGNWASR